MARIGDARWRYHFAVALIGKAHGIFHAMTCRLSRWRYPAGAQRGVHLANCIERLCVSRRARRATIFGGVVARLAHRIVLIGRNDGQPQILANWREVFGKARSTAEDAAEMLPSGDPQYAWCIRRDWSRPRLRDCTRIRRIEDRWLRRCKRYQRLRTCFIRNRAQHKKTYGYKPHFSRLRAAVLLPYRKGYQTAV